MQLTLQELRYVIALAEKKNFVKAAASCFVSQSTLSTQLKKLEEKLGVTIFDRSQQQLAPTPIGIEIIERARHTLNEAEKIEQIAMQSKEPMTGVLKLGVIPTVGPYLLPAFIKPIKKRFPSLQLIIREDLTEHLLDQLRTGSLDAIIVSPSMEFQQHNEIHLCWEPFMLALPASDPLCEKKTISLHDIASSNIMLLEDGHCLRGQAMEICKANNIVLKDEIMGTSLETLKQMVALGAGITFFPALAVSRSMKSSLKDMIVCRPIADKKFGRMIAMVWRNGFPGEQTVITLASFMKANLPDEVQAV